MRIEFAADVPEVDRAKALDWWWDFREGGHDHDFVAFDTYRTVSELAEGEVLVEERVRGLGVQLFRERFVAWLDGYTVAFEGANTYATFKGIYAFERGRQGTRIELSAQVHLKPWIAWTERLARPVVERILRRDLEGHAEQMVVDLS